jgi:probable lipoprotein NlpC
MKTKPGQIFKSRLFLILITLIIAVFFSSCSSTKKIRNQNVNKVIDTARSYRGTPYRYGGTTRSGIDCSALIYHSFQPVGINMPRTSEAQSKMGKKVNGSKLEKGDLVFFSTGKSRKKVSHAGIVTETSSTSLGVTEDNLDHSYWSKAFRFGRRVL